MSNASVTSGDGFLHSEEMDSLMERKKASNVFKKGLRVMDKSVHVASKHPASDPGVARALIDMGVRNAYNNNRHDQCEFSHFLQESKNNISHYHDVENQCVRDLSTRFAAREQHQRKLNESRLKMLSAHNIEQRRIVENFIKAEVNVLVTHDSDKRQAAVLEVQKVLLEKSKQVIAQEGKISDEMKRELQKMTSEHKTIIAEAKSRLVEERLDQNKKLVMDCMDMVTEHKKKTCDLLPLTNETLNNVYRNLGVQTMPREVSKKVPSPSNELITELCAYIDSVVEMKNTIARGEDATSEEHHASHQHDSLLKLVGIPQRNSLLEQTVSNHDGREIII